MRIPSPGSHDAQRAGCRCCPRANQFGLGTPEGSRIHPTFELHARCPVHPADYVWTAPSVDELKLLVGKDAQRGPGRPGRPRMNLLTGKHAA